MDYATSAFRKVRGWLSWGQSSSTPQPLQESTDQDYNTDFEFDFPKHVPTKEEKEEVERTLTELYLPIQPTSSTISSHPIVEVSTHQIQDTLNNPPVNPLSHFETPKVIDDTVEDNYEIVEYEETPVTQLGSQETEKIELSNHEMYIELIAAVNKWLILLGGASIVSFALRHYLLGKRLFVLEYPGGTAKTLTIHRNSVLNLKKNIIRKETPLFPGVILLPTDIIHLASWIPPQYTEPITSASQIRNLPEDSWVLWSKESELYPIPRRGVNLLDDKVTRYKMDAAIKFIEKLHLTQNTKDNLIDLLVEDDKELMTLFHYFHYNPSNFSKQALLYLRSKRKKESEANSNRDHT